MKKQLLLLLLLCGLSLPVCARPDTIVMETEFPGNKLHYDSLFVEDHLDVLPLPSTPSKPSKAKMDVTHKLQVLHDPTEDEVEWVENIDPTEDEDHWKIVYVKPQSGSTVVDSRFRWNAKTIHTRAVRSQNKQGGASDLSCTDYYGRAAAVAIGSRTPHENEGKTEIGPSHVDITNLYLKKFEKSNADCDHPLALGTAELWVSGEDKILLYRDKLKKSSDNAAARITAGCNKVQWKKASSNYVYLQCVN